MGQRSVRFFIVFLVLLVAGACGAHRLPKELNEEALKEIREKLADGDTYLSYSPVEGTDLKHAQIYGVVDTDIDTMWRIITDYERYEEFMPLLLHSQVKWTRGNVAKFEMIFGLPAVLEPRYNLTVAMVHYPEKYRIEWVYIEGDIVDTFGSWTLKPFGDGRTEVVYSMFLDLTGTLVGPFAQFGVGFVLPEAISALRDEAENSRYIDLQLPEYARGEARRPTIIDQEFAAFD